LKLSNAIIEKMHLPKINHSSSQNVVGIRKVSSTEKVLRKSDIRFEGSGLIDKNIV